MNIANPYTSCRSPAAADRIWRSLTALVMTMAFACGDTTNETPSLGDTAAAQSDTAEADDFTERPDVAVPDVNGPWDTNEDVTDGTDDASDAQDVSVTDTAPPEDTSDTVDTSSETTDTAPGDNSDGEDTADDTPPACTALVTTPADFDHTFSWDGDGRLIGITWVFPPPLAPGPSEPKDATATYDAEGRLLSTCCRHWPYPSGNAHHEYDAMGRHIGYEVVTPANPSAKPWEELTYTWHEDGTVATATRTTQITDEIVDSWSFVYAPDGRLAQRSYDNWIEEVHYDDAGCLSHFLQKFLLPGDGPAELTLTIGHDAQGRLTTFNHPEQGMSIISWSDGCDLINVGIPNYPGVIDPRFPGLPTQFLPGHICPP